ncbi:MAG: hypothetical protein AAGF24_14985 [Cyanobacteria bacterium P01_H01_bin.121]
MHQASIEAIAPRLHNGLQPAQYQLNQLRAATDAKAIALHLHNLRGAIKSVDNNLGKIEEVTSES